MTLETKRGEPILDRGRLLVPVVHSWTLSVPGRRGALIWNRPAGVEIEERGERFFLPVHDHTRRFQWFCLGIGAAALLLSRMRRRMNRRSRLRRFVFGR